MLAVDIEDNDDDKPNEVNEGTALDDERGVEVIISLVEAKEIDDKPTDELDCNELLELDPMSVVDDCGAVDGISGRLNVDVKLDIDLVEVAVDEKSPEEDDVLNFKVDSDDEIELANVDEIDVIDVELDKELLVGRYVV